MDKLVKHEGGLAFRHGRRVAIRLSRDDQDLLPVLLNLFGALQISSLPHLPRDLLVYVQWAGPLDELDARLKQIGKTGLTLVGLVEEEAEKPAIDTAVRACRVAVRLWMKNGPLLVYLTSLLTSVRVVPVPYSEQLWVEGTFSGSLILFESSLRELKAEELIVLNGQEGATGTVNEPVSHPAPVAAPPVPRTSLPATASAPEGLQKSQQRLVTTRMRRATRWWKVVGVLLVVLVVGSVGLVVVRFDSVTRFLNPPQVVMPAAPDPQTVPWSHMVHQEQFRSWISIQQQNGWSNEQMTEFLVKLRRLKTDYFQYPSVVARSLALLRSQNVRTEQDFSAFSQSLRLRMANGWPFPDQPQDAPLLSLSADYNFSVVSFYEALAQQPDVVGWLLERVGHRAG